MLGAEGRSALFPSVTTAQTAVQATTLRKGSRYEGSGQKDKLPGLGQIGLSNYAPYLMNRIMGRYNASIREEMSALGLTTPKMRSSQCCR